MHAGNSATLYGMILFDFVKLNLEASMHPPSCSMDYPTFQSRGATTASTRSLRASPFCETGRAMRGAYALGDGWSMSVGSKGVGHGVLFLCKALKKPGTSPPRPPESSRAHHLRHRFASSVFRLNPGGDHKLSVQHFRDPNRVQRCSN